MIAVDTNILVYAHRPDSPWHSVARSSVKELAENPAPWAILWPCVHEFLSTATHPRIYRPPSTPLQAIEQVEAWRESPSLALLGEGPDHWETLKRLVSAGRIAGGAVHDTRVAALCLQHGVTALWSADRDFSRFPDLKVVNPLLR